ncbi:MAG: polyhydroxyalkanoate depolymerase [Rhodospirillales bacterium]|nr:polyhydroxyalkanoate depolymerase [Rhodospirillales bacterium]
MLYQAYELTHAALTPYRALSQMAQYINSSIYNPVAYTPFGKSVSAFCNVFNTVTKRYGKPEWEISETERQGKTVPVDIETVLCTPFGDLINFQKTQSAKRAATDPKVLLVAPLSGHYATLLRGTVKAMLPDHDVYVTDWRDARSVPLSIGKFDLEDHVETIIDFIRFLGPDVHVIAVCQPSVSVLAAVAVMAQNDDPCQPKSMTLMGGPIDTRINPTAVNSHAQTHDISWFKQNVITRVPFPHMGVMREVYPGFVQLSGFMTMNLDRHMDAHMDLYNHLVEGDGDSETQHRAFYDEYLSVMDLPAEFFLQTVQSVFLDHALAKGTMTHAGRKVDPGAIAKTALMTVEGEKDDICGVGQTGAAHGLCKNLSASKKLEFIQPGVGHYGVFNGRRWRDETQPKIAAFIRANS